MKILFLQDDFPPEILGGGGKVAFYLAKAINNLGHQVYIITTVRDKSQAGQLDYQGLKIYRLYADYHERWRAYLSLCNPQTVSLVEKIIKNIQPDVAHIHNIHYYLSYYCFKIAKKYSRAVFLTAHDVMPFHYGKLIEFINPADLSVPQSFDYRISPWRQIKRFKKRYNPFRNIITRHYLKYPDKIFAVSSALKEAWRQNGVTGLEVIHNGIDADDWRVDSQSLEEFRKKYHLFDKKIIFFGGKINPLKGGDNILEAMKLVSQEIPQAALLVMGRENNYLNQIAEKANRANISLIKTGWIDGDERKAVYLLSDIVATPSLCLDSFPTINLEAMACQKPVIGTCFGGTPEIVEDGITGYIVNPFNIRAMADRIIDLLKDRQKAIRFGRAGYERVKEHFTVKGQAEKTLGYYRGML